MGTPFWTLDLQAILKPIFKAKMPNFTADTTEGKIDFHDWIGDSWAILFSHPADYTPVCTTELGRVVTLKPEFDKRGVKMIALSCDNVEDHKGWGKDVMEYAGCGSSTLPFPIIADEDRSLAVQLGMVDPTPVDWTSGGQCMVVPSLSNEEALKLFPQMEKRVVPSGKEYLRFTPQPQ